MFGTTKNEKSDRRDNKSAWWLGWLGGLLEHLFYVVHACIHECTSRMCESTLAIVLMVGTKKHEKSDEIKSVWWLGLLGLLGGLLWWLAGAFVLRCACVHS